jgi:hypothetical protein
MSAGVIVAIVKGINIDARNMSVLSAAKHWSHETMVNEWEENIHFKVLHSRVIDLYSSGPMSHSFYSSWFLDHYINRIH